MDSTWRVGRLFGIPVGIHVSWLFIFALIVWSLGADYFPMHRPGLGGAGNWAAAVVAALLFSASILAHELAHSLVARAHGIPVERITLFALGGLSVLKREASRPRSELLVAVAGPLLSIAFGVLLGAMWWNALREDTSLGAVVLYLAYGNLALGAFNLLPALPLDGGRALRALLWAICRDTERATLRALAVARVVTVGLVLVGLLQVMTSDGAGGLWLVLIAWMLWSSGEEERRRIAVESVLRGRNVAPLVRFEILSLDAEDTLGLAAERIVAAPPQSLYPVLAGDELMGSVTPAMFNAVAPGLWATTRTRWLARRAPAIPAISPDTEALVGLAILDRLGVEAILVRETGSGVVGLLERGAIARWIEVGRSGPAVSVDPQRATRT